ncbi:MULTISPECIES: hypothetical protein [Stenotrophomonas maltophilia group]|uniref:hypothetical protein n=2 Tax=Stenotrophomonas TaxID=40323 RepID=UPI004040F336
MNNHNHHEKDQQFRAQMASSKEPVAEKWTELDRKAQEQKSEVERMQRSMERRLDPERLVALEERAADLANQRHEMEVRGRPNLFLVKQRAAYDKQMAELEAGLKETRKDIRTWLRKSDPAEIAKHQERMASKQEELVKTIEQRQGVSQMPSERAKEEQQRAGQVEIPMMRLDEWRKQRQRSDDVQVDFPKYGAGKWGGATFAATALAEQKKMRLYEEEFDWQKQGRERQPNVFRQ